MKKHLLFCCAVACALTSQAADAAYNNNHSRKLAERYSQLRKASRAAETDMTDKVWLPGTAADYWWDADGSTWAFNNETKYTYTDNGKVASSKEGNNEISYTYNEKGQKLTETYSYEGTPSSKHEYEYDAVTGVEIKSTSYSYDNGQWSLSSVWERRITRDTKGNITKVEDYDTSEGKEELTGYQVYNYGTDGKITEIINYDVYEGESEVEFHLTDIVWDRTDGQLIVEDTNDMDTDEYFMGANRIKSATAIDFDGDGFTAAITAEYPDDLGSVNVKMACKDVVFYEVEYKVLDSYGSYSQSEIDFEYEVNEAAGTLTLGDKYSYFSSEKYDANGIMVESVEKSQSPDWSSNRIEVAEVTFDQTNGYPTEIVYRSGEDATSLTNNRRVVYSDYAAYTGIEGVAADNSAAPVEYYNLQGVRVANPTTGIYVRRQGTSVSKVFVK